MKLPNFLCIGAQKCGTTFLHEILKSHPEIYLPSQKEAHFFDRDANFLKGIDWYQSTFFKNAENYKRIGEITPAYIYFEFVPKRIKVVLGDNVKLILILRNPVDRAYSDYWMEYGRGNELLSFDEALVMEHCRIRKGYEEKALFSYITRGFYYEQITRYLNYFPLENIKIMIFEEFFRNIPAAINELLTFLDCNNYQMMIETKKQNTVQMEFSKHFKALFLNRKCASNRFILSKRYDYPPLKNRYRHFLVNIYKEDILKLQSLLNKDLSMWLRGYIM